MFAISWFFVPATVCWVLLYEYARLHGKTTHITDYVSRNYRNLCSGNLAGTLFRNLKPDKEKEPAQLQWYPVAASDCGVGVSLFADVVIV